MKYFLGVIFLFLSLFGGWKVMASPDTAQKLDAKLFQELRWRSIGPARGGRALAVTGVRGQPDTLIRGFAILIVCSAALLSNGSRGSWTWRR